MSDARRTRRFDPDRRRRIVDAAIDVIVAHGVTGTTHRKVAEAAEVPLGSMTYHFTGLDDLLHAAFEQVAHAGSRAMLARLDEAPDREAAVTAIVDIIADKLWSAPRTLLLSYELYAYAARHPAVAVIMRDWMQRSREALGRHFDPLTARAVDAMIEGIGIHDSVDSAPLDRSDIDHIVRRIIVP